MQRAGWLRHRITIQKKVITRDGYGDEVIAWSKFAKVWASIEPMRGREYIEGRQAQADVSTKIRIRHRTGVKPYMRVSHESRTYEIESVIDILEKRRAIELMCRELINA